MNRKQKIVLLAGILLAGLALVFPPTGPVTKSVYSIEGPSNWLIVTGVTIVNHECRFGLLDYESARYDMLAMELVMVGVVSGLLIWALRGGRPVKSER